MKCMKKMAAGGKARAADGIAKRGKTKAKMVKMAKGGAMDMKKKGCK